MVFNGSIPGPTIEANWGDDIVIHVTNKLKNNGYVLLNVFSYVYDDGMRMLT